MVTVVFVCATPISCCYYYYYYYYYYYIIVRYSGVATIKTGQKDTAPRALKALLVFDFIVTLLCYVSGFGPLSCTTSRGFMDDFTFGGHRATVASHVLTVVNKGKEFGLSLNSDKCEVIAKKGAKMSGLMSSFKPVAPDSATLLGAPLSAGLAMDACLADRCADLTRAAERLKLVSAHDALLLLKSCLSASKLLYTLRSSHCEGHGLLHTFDDLQKSLLCHICNVSLTDEQWLQASLPVRNAGLGVRRVSSLASSTFLASAAGTRQLQDQLLRRTGADSDEDFDQCLAGRLHPDMPEGKAAGRRNGTGY